MTTVSAADRRDAGRLPFAAQAMLLHHDAAWFVQVLDLSEGGCCVFGPDQCDLSEGNVVRLFFHPGARTRAIAVSGRIAHVGNGRIGIEYHEPQCIPPAQGG